jgi:hypothetical protein
MPLSRRSLGVAPLAAWSLEAMQHFHVPVDYFIYPNDGHVSERPEHRFMSLQRNLDWFEFWLLNVENEPAAKGDQYAHWRTLRDENRVRSATN